MSEVEKRTRPTATTKENLVAGANTWGVVLLVAMVLILLFFVTFAYKATHLN